MFTIITLITALIVAVLWLGSVGSLGLRSFSTLVLIGLVWAQYGMEADRFTDGAATKMMGVAVLAMLIIPFIFKTKEEDEVIVEEEPVDEFEGMRSRDVMSLEDEVNAEGYLPMSTRDAVTAISGNSDEYVYVVDNPAFATGLVKIGMTTQSDYDNRIRSLQRSGTPLPFRKRLIIRTDDARSLERRLHAAFDHKRLAGNREFFTVSPQEVMDILPRMGAHTVIEANL